MQSAISLGLFFLFVTWFWILLLDDEISSHDDESEAFPEDPEDEDIFSLLPF